MSKTSPEEEIVAELVENGLPDEGYMLEAVREGDVDAAAGGMGVSNQEMLQYLAELAAGNRDAKPPEPTIAY